MALIYTDEKVWINSYQIVSYTVKKYKDYFHLYTFTLTSGDVFTIKHRIDSIPESRMLSQLSK